MLNLRFKTTSMKKSLIKPSFEFIFALSLIAILGLPPLLMAQNQKDVEISIQHGDTIINGKNIKELSAKDKQAALKDINRLSDNDNSHSYTFKRKDSVDGRVSHFEFHKRGSENNDHSPLTSENIVIKDSLGNIMMVKRGRVKQMNTRSDFKFNGNDDLLNRPELPERNFGGSLLMRSDRRNSQNFDFVNIDNDGISTHIRFHVSEISDEDLKRMPHVEGPKFEIEDLNIVPEFSTGKTLMTFNLPGKTVADVKLIDSEGKLIWNEKVSGGRFMKSFVMGLNGIYYLQIKQGNSFALKRILKEE
jgi:hypothetical protein